MVVIVVIIVPHSSIPYTPKVSLQAGVLPPVLQALGPRA